MLALFLTVVLTVRAQKVTFYSPEFEFGVKMHLELDESDDVLQSQMDAITEIDLSGLDITDIRDVVYLPNVKLLNLSYNAIDDVSSLLPLDSLHVLDLSNNQLKSINILAFMERDSMQVDISNNFIEDLSFFYAPIQCRFIFIGSEMQQDTDILLGDVNGEGRVDEVDAQQILDVSAGVKSIGDLTVPEAVGVPGGSSNALEVNAQKVLDYSVAGDKPW